MFPWNTLYRTTTAVALVLCGMAIGAAASVYLVAASIAVAIVLCLRSALEGIFEDDEEERAQARARDIVARIFSDTEAR